MEFAELIKIPKLDGVTMRTPHHEDVFGTLCITGHHLILSSRIEGVQELMILHNSIDVIERKDNKPGPTGVAQGGSLVLKCKDLRIVTLEIGTTSDLTKVAQSLENLCNASDSRLQYPFFYKPNFQILEDGYKIFRVEMEYAKLLSTEEWKLSWVNHDYGVCPTYPKVLVVPKHCDDESLAQSAAFRRGGRFPLLSYRHENGAVLLRSSEPLVGSQNKRCKPDEKLLNMFVSNDKKGYIFDLRTPNLLVQQKSKGGGLEPDSNYPQWRKVNRGLDKISGLQLLESFTKLVDVCNDKDISCEKWLSKLDSCGWMTHVSTSLNVACTVAQCLERETVPVLVHGTRGMDSTLLVCSLVQIILNPDCRTVRGIQALIDREWLQGGYPFASRHRRSCYYNFSSSLSISQPVSGLRKASFASTITTNQASPLVSPTFLLFLDCVHQLLEQFPCSFEFTQDLLILLFEHSYYSQFGTFLGDCEREREELNVYKQTTSLWSYLNTPQHIESVLSPLYEPNQGIIWPSVAPMSLVLWEELFLRWVIDFTEHRLVLAQIAKIREKDKELRVKAVRLRRQLADLIREVRELEENVGLSQDLLALSSQEEVADIQAGPEDGIGEEKE